MMDTLVATVGKNAVEEIRISLTTYKDRDLVDIRTYYQDDTGDWKPTRKGICVTAEQWPDLRDALAKIDAHLPAEGSPPRRRSPRGAARG